MFNSAFFTSAGLRTFAATALLLSGFAPAAVSPAQSRDGNRTLRLYYTHTKEKGEFTFKKNGRYDRAALEKLNYFLRDWRRNEPTRMDPQLFDLVWAIQQQAGSSQPIHIVSSYRSLKTNNQLRARSRGVAQKSQHTAGKAMDFFIPGVPLAKLRAIALKLQVGGVGYYPSSGSPFIHVDTGSVRMWPRMTRTQLAAIFPKGDTMYLPSDGKPLAGYELAKAKFGNKSKDVQMAALASTTPSGGGSGSKGNVGSWLKRVFTESPDEVEDNEMGGAPQAPARAAPAAPVAPAAPLPVAEPEVLVAAAEPAAPAVVPPPLPRIRPAGAPAATNPDAGSVAMAFAEVPLPRPRPSSATAAIMAATASTAPTAPASDMLADLASRMDVATPRAADAAQALDIRTASLPPATQPGAPQVEPTSAVAAAIQLGQNGRADGLPRPRPAAQLAYADRSGGTEVTYETAYGGRYADVARAKPKTSRLPVTPLAVASLGGGVTAPAADADIATAPASRVDQAIAASVQPVDENMRRLMSQLTTRTQAFATMARPEPAKGAVLFTAPEKIASAQGFNRTEVLRTDRFGGTPAPAEVKAEKPSLMQKLFGIF